MVENLLKLKYINNEVHVEIGCMLSINHIYNRYIILKKRILVFNPSKT
uniref:Uncharacterized protein n=1 Tax=Nelumbo nucifera TaxID=4432 RepID=A0A822Z4Z8_NELNU|nr:TPA_asm: hypothetical protein HUJ06_013993 [Nelumbo nucifera]